MHKDTLTKVNCVLEQINGLKSAHSEAFTLRSILGDVAEQVVSLKGWLEKDDHENAQWNKLRAMKYMCAACYQVRDLALTLKVDFTEALCAIHDLPIIDVYKTLELMKDCTVLAIQLSYTAPVLECHLIKLLSNIVEARLSEAPEEYLALHSIKHDLARVTDAYLETRQDENLRLTIEELRWHYGQIYPEPAEE